MYTIITVIKRLKKFFAQLGPGFITGAADDDPSGIATYSIAGAQFGYQMNWLSIFLIPMMISIQEMCGRIGMVSGMGLTGVIKKYHSKGLLYFAVSLLVIANLINLAADLGMMAASIQMLLGYEFLFWLISITLVTVTLEVTIPYKKYMVFLRIMGLTLLVYLLTMVLVKQDWQEIFLFTFIPHIDLSTAYILTLIGFTGTTISPYLFFWQASEEVEEEIASGDIKDFRQLPKVETRQIVRMRRDTNIGMVFAQIVTMGIVLTTAATLHKNGIVDLETPHQIAMALKPLAGDFAYVLFAIGIIGIGLQAIPVLTGGIAYAVSEMFGVSEGLSKPFRKAKIFYGIIAVATLVGALMNIIGVNPIKALYYAAIINGIISVPLIFIILKLADDPRVVGTYTTQPTHRIVGWITFIFITLACGFMLYNFLPI